MMMRESLLEMTILDRFFASRRIRAILLARSGCQEGDGIVIIFSHRRQANQYRFNGMRLQNLNRRYFAMACQYHFATSCVVGIHIDRHR